MLHYDRPVTELIQKRRSWRTYSDEPVESDIKVRLNDTISTLAPPPFGSKIRFSLMEPALPGEKRVKGTYGVISGAGTFLVGAVQQGEKAFEDFGYVMESLILFITSLNLGTCWIGGTLSRSYFGGKMALKHGELIPAITPVGYVKDKRSLLDSFFYLIAGSRNRKAFSDLFFDNDFNTPISCQGSGDYAQALEMVRLAPSASNKQPWRIVRKNKGFHFFLCRTPGYNVLLGDVDIQRIDMGIAMFHFQSSAHLAGLKGTWAIVDPGISPIPKRTCYIASWIEQT